MNNQQFMGFYLNIEWKLLEITQRRDILLLLLYQISGSGEEVNSMSVIISMLNSIIVGVICHLIYKLLDRKL